MRCQTVFSSVLCSRRITSLISRNDDLSVFAGMQSECATKLVCDDHDRPARNDRYVVVGPHLHIVIRSHQSHSPSPVGPVPTHDLGVLVHSSNVAPPHHHRSCNRSRRLKSPIKPPTPLAVRLPVSRSSILVNAPSFSGNRSER